MIGKCLTRWLTSSSGVMLLGRPAHRAARLSPSADPAVDHRAARASCSGSSQQRSRWPAAAGSRASSGGTSVQLLERVRAAGPEVAALRGAQQRRGQAARSAAGARAAAGRAGSASRAGPRCRGAGGRRRSRRAVPCSTIRPAYMTATRSAISATTPRSWVIMITAIPSSCLEALEQLQDLRLGGDVERGRRLVGDQQLRLVGERHRDHRPLAHPAGELVRVVVDPARGLGHADQRRAARSPARRASRSETSRWAWIASTSWSPTL